MEFTTGLTVAGPGARAPRLTRQDTLMMASTDAPPVPWLVRPLLVRGALTLLAGREGVGKSMLAMAVAVGVAGDAGQVGPFDVQAGRVLVVDAENGPGELHRRIRGLGLTTKAAQQITLYTTESGDVLNDLAELDGVIGAEQPDLVVLDSFRSLWTGKENDSETTGPALYAVQNLARRTGAAILLLHHASRTGDYRGSTAIGGATEIVVGMSRAPDDPQNGRYVLRWGKMLPTARPAPVWVRLAVELGCLMSLEEAEPFDAEQVSGAATPAMDDLAPRVLGVLEDAGEAHPVIGFVGTSTVSADRVLTGPADDETHSGAADAAEWLEGALADGPQPAYMPSPQPAASTCEGRAPMGEPASGLGSEDPKPLPEAHTCPTSETGHVWRG